MIFFGCKGQVIHKQHSCFYVKSKKDRGHLITACPRLSLEHYSGTSQINSTLPRFYVSPPLIVDFMHANED